MHNFIIENMKKQTDAILRGLLFHISRTVLSAKKEKITMEIQVLTFPKR